MEQYSYYFNDVKREIRFDRFDLPAPWINYLSNGRMHAFVSQAGGDLTTGCRIDIFVSVRKRAPWVNRA